MSARVTTIYNDKREDVALSLYLDLDFSHMGKLLFAERNPDAPSRSEKYEFGTKVYNWDEGVMFVINETDATELKTILEKYKETKDVSYMIKKTSGELIVGVDPSTKELYLELRSKKNLKFIFSSKMALSTFYRFLFTVSNYGFMMKAIYQSIAGLLKSDTSAPKTSTQPSPVENTENIPTDIGDVYDF